MEGGKGIFCRMVVGKENKGFGMLGEYRLLIKFLT